MANITHLERISEANSLEQSMESVSNDVKKLDGLNNVEYTFFDFSKTSNEAIQQQISKLQGKKENSELINALYKEMKGYSKKDMT